MKAQSIRLMDVFLLGPFMVYLAMKPSMTNEQRAMLALAGIATILYNGRNYLLIEQGEQDAAA